MFFITVDKIIGSSSSIVLYYGMKHDQKQESDRETDKEAKRERRKRHRKRDRQTDREHHFADLLGWLALPIWTPPVSCSN